MINNAVKNFIFDWENFIIDYWWRRKYKVPFGSIQHREMNFIDMYIEYIEEKMFNASNTYQDDFEDELLGLKDDTEKTILTQKEIDNEYDNLDLNQFNK